MRRTLALAATLLVPLTACSRKPAADAPAPVETPAEAANTAPADAPVPAATPGEDVCFEALAVSWKGALDAPPGVERTQEEAEARAAALLLRLERDGDPFDRVAREASDRWQDTRGYVGTYRTDDWPGTFSLLKGELLSVSPGMTTPVVETPHGYVIARRCPVQTARFRKILVRFAGAEGAPENVDRTEDDARELAEGLHALLTAAPGDFPDVARTRSDDAASREDGGLVGPFVRGRVPEPLGADGFSMAPYKLSPVYRVAEGYVFYQRVPDDDAAAPPAGGGSPGETGAAPADGTAPAGAATGSSPG